MLFNSVEFIFLFLPLSLLAFYFFERMTGRALALCSIIAFSALFYASWNPSYLLILLASVTGNYWIGTFLQSSTQENWRRAGLVIAVVTNLLLLYYFKYLSFTISLFPSLSISQGDGFFKQWALPLGISFWTFQQINFLLERYNSIEDDLNFLDYVSIVLFFPHLIAGPIVRAGELGHQVREVGRRRRFLAKDLSVGTFLFVVGLLKKVVIADTISHFPSRFYQLPAGEVMEKSGPLLAWFAIISYMLQLYFDFSGYCDMGMGLARMFGFVFPLNFNSPLKATSFVEFWRSWHITLTRFFTDTLHTPLAIALTRRFGDVNSQFLQNILTIAAPVIFTFFLTGVWHGAGMQFVVFGLLNGILMAIGIVAIQYRLSLRWKWLARLLTFLLVSIVFIFFRTPNVHFGYEVIRCLFTWPRFQDLQRGIEWVQADWPATIALALALVVSQGAPSIYQVLGRWHTPLGFKRNRVDRNEEPWTLPMGAALALLTASGFFLILYQLLRGGAVEFLYFQF